MGGLRVEEHGTVQGFLQQVFALKDPELAAGCVTFMWVIWEACNRHVFQGIQPTLENMVTQMQMLGTPRELSLPYACCSRFCCCVE